MAREDGSYTVGFGRPPRSSQFKPGQSGNPRGRPKGAKNFATALEAELDARVTITENGKRKRVSKREVIAKHLVNKAAGGDLKAIPLLLNEARHEQANSAVPDPEDVFDTSDDQKVFEDIIRRVRESDPVSPASDSGPALPTEQEPPPTAGSDRVEE